MRPVVAGLLLAAGAGRRLGRPKALVELDGEPLVRRGVRLLGDGGCAPVHVVLGAGVDELPELPGAVPVRHDRWPDGLGSSLLRGLASLPADTPAAVVVLVDQPLLSPVAVRRVRLAYADGAVVAVATYAGRGGHPSCWAGDLVAAARIRRRRPGRPRPAARPAGAGRRGALRRRRLPGRRGHPGRPAPAARGAGPPRRSTGQRRVSQRGSPWLVTA
ncbi:nucleotidyltransferase family protein [Micromonospora tarensis]|uniref:nucleotidyltransferase family protein n=1 Tax=Micromonospora tarensis TaxID=2806100 RepID=UPI002814B29F|nr:NTP transferase domain-containing protein [Micromonospora tarensis]